MARWVLCCQVYALLPPSDTVISKVYVPGPPTVGLKYRE